uniref:DUF4220 domain-containing protein n=1 Tax=Oryza rufipogon TaxID=4529 RepID=A0A0E0REP4_ORYRU
MDPGIQQRSSPVLERNEMEEHLSVRNATRSATAWAASPVGRLVRIEVLVTISCCLLAVLVLLGSGRRAIHSAGFRLAVWSALMLSYPAVSYTIGLMQSASTFRNELIVAWGCFLLLLLGCADGIAAYSLNDSDQQARTVLNQGLQLVYVFILLISYVGSLPLQLKVLLLLLWALSAIKLGMRVRSFLSAGRDSVLTVENKLIADYMSREHEYSGRNYDAATMKGYKYVVVGEADQKDDNGDYHPIDQSNLDRSIITVEKVWECQGRLLLSSNGGDDAAASRRRDLCLSFAMFKLLRRRLGGYPLSEAHLNKTRDFVKVGLLAAADDHERMYRVIEVELGFLFDFYYARYRSPRETLIPDTLLFAAVLVASLSTLLSPAVLNHRARSNSVANGFDIWLTRTVIALFLFLESFQYLTLVFSDWHKVKMLCRYVREPTWQEHPGLELILKWMCHVRLIRYWNNSVGQYSLLLACLPPSRWRCTAGAGGVLCLPFPKPMARFLLRSRMTHHRKLPEEVKRAIYLFLRSGLARVRHGQYALEKNGALGVLYPPHVRQPAEMTTGTVQLILIWHIATELCDTKPQRQLADSGAKQDHLVATTLSSYCAYLVSSAPELLPERSYDTQRLLEGVQRKAREFLRGCRSRDDMYDKLPATVSDSQASDVHNILVEGRRVGEILGKMDTTKKWKLLAELWVELILSVAPSDNAASHVQMLANGGELITHLWALLTHAGVVDKRTCTENKSP